MAISTQRHPASIGSTQRSVASNQLLDVERVRADFPLLSRTVRDGKRLVYLDSGATSQKPRSVLDAEREFYERHNAAVHRGAHQLAEEATDAYESARRTIAGFIGADEGEVVFTKNATEGVNLVAYAMSNAATAGSVEAERFRLGPGDEVVVTEMEHHANLVPWQQLCERTGATLRWLSVTAEGRLELSNLDDVVTPRTKVFAFAHQSNVLGTVNPVELLVARAHEVGALVVLDAAQSVPHLPVDVHALGCRLRGLQWPQDARPARGRRALGPALASRGDAAVPDRRVDDRGRPHRALDVRAAAAAVRGRCADGGAGGRARGGLRLPLGRRHGCRCRARARARGVRARRRRLASRRTHHRPHHDRARGATVAFVVDGIHAHDVGQLLDGEGVAVRVGHHCAWPLHRAFGVAATTRASFYLYNDTADVDALVAAIAKAQRYFGVA